MVSRRDSGLDTRDTLRSARKNMKSVEENPQVVSDYLEAEKKRQVLLGPFKRSEVAKVHLSHFGVIPKKSQPGKRRLIAIQKGGVLTMELVVSCVLSSIHVWRRWFGNCLNSARGFRW